ncbi:MAG: hypothetical protein VKJ46_14700 [Leptolyngbyaceae bacterium]|nr:hypothetical protein [Leptolyngbyaceae bacterium]
MSQDVTKWLAEIKALQQQLAETQKDRNAADSSAANWRKLYETEAQQRRTEAASTQQKIEGLNAEIQRLRGGAALDRELAVPASDIQAEVEKLQTTTDLQRRLTEALLACSQLQEQVLQLTQALETEQANHLQTRKSLTTALGDTVDLLTKERAARGIQEGVNSAAVE